MSRRYLVVDGSFARADGTVAREGDVVELDDDVAQRCAFQLKALPAEAAAAVAPAQPVHDTAVES